MIEDASSQIQTLFTDEAELVSLQFNNVTLPQTVARAVSLERCQLKRVDISFVSLPKLVVLHCTFSGCTAVSSRLTESSLRNLSFTNCRFSGIQLQDSIIKDVTFKNCKLDMANFRMTKFKNVSFEGCQMQEVDFDSAESTNVSFNQCDLTKAIFNNSRNTNLDLREAMIDDIQGVESLKNAIISSDQLYTLAPQLAAHIGFKILDE